MNYPIFQWEITSIYRQIFPLGSQSRLNNLQNSCKGKHFTYVVWWHIADTMFLVPSPSRNRLQCPNIFTNWHHWLSCDRFDILRAQRLAAVLYNLPILLPLLDTFTANRLRLWKNTIWRWNFYMKYAPLDVCQALWDWGWLVQVVPNNYNSS